MKSVSGSLKINLAQYRDMQAFAMFASDLDATTRRQLERGARLTELLKQGQYSPYPVEEQVVSVWGGTNGHFDDVPVDDVLRFEQEFLDHLRHNTQVLSTLAETKKFDDDIEQALVKEFDNFKQGFRTTDGKLLVGSEQHEAIAEDEVDATTIVRQNRG